MEYDTNMEQHQIDRHGLIPYESMEDYSMCPECGSDTEILDEAWDPCVNTETLSYKCPNCGCRFAMIMLYRPVAGVKKVL